MKRLASRGTRQETEKRREEEAKEPRVAQKGLYSDVHQVFFPRNIQIAYIKNNPDPKKEFTFRTCVS